MKAKIFRMGITLSMLVMAVEALGAPASSTKPTRRSWTTGRRDHRAPRFRLSLRPRRTRGRR